MAIRATIIAGLILVFFAMFGEALLGFLHIDLDSFRIAGGIMLFIIAIDMVFEKRTERREHRAEEHLGTHSADPEPDDISVFPLGIPMVAGPGSIATAMFYMSDKSDWIEKGVVLSAIGLNLLLTLVIFLIAGPLVRLMGASVAGALTRILGVILAALSVQLLIDGIRGAFNL